MTMRERLATSIKATASKAKETAAQIQAARKERAVRLLPLHVMSLYQLPLRRARTHTHTHTRTHTASILHSGSHSRQYHCAVPHRAVPHQAQAKHKVTAEIVDGEERRIRVVVPLGKGKLGINVSEEDGPSFITKVGGATPSCLSGGATLLRVSWATPLPFVGRRVVPQLCESRGPHSSLLLYCSAHPCSVLHICPICQ
jgi:hypothetical protein